MPLTNSTPATCGADIPPGNENLKLTLFSTLFFWSLRRAKCDVAKCVAVQCCIPAGHKFLLVSACVAKSIDVELATEVHGGGNAGRCRRQRRCRAGRVGGGESGVMTGAAAAHNVRACGLGHIPHASSTLSADDSTS